MTYQPRRFSQGYAHAIRIRLEYLQGKRTTSGRRSGMEQKWRTPDCICAEVNFAIWDGHQYELEHLAHRYGLYPNSILWLSTFLDLLPRKLFRRACNQVKWGEQLLGRGMTNAEISSVVRELEREHYWAEYDWAANQKRMANTVNDVLKKGDSDE